MFLIYKEVGNFLKRIKIQIIRFAEGLCLYNALYLKKKPSYMLYESS